MLSLDFFYAVILDDFAPHPLFRFLLLLHSLPSMLSKGINESALFKLSFLLHSLLAFLFLLLWNDFEIVSCNEESGERTISIFLRLLNFAFSLEYDV